MTITPEINPETGLTVYAWKIGESGGYAATPEDAFNDANRCEIDQLRAIQRQPKGWQEIEAD